MGDVPGTNPLFERLEIEVDGVRRWERAVGLGLVISHCPRHVGRHATLGAFWDWRKDGNHDAAVIGIGGVDFFAGKIV
jgi:hypothetical protein